MSVKIKPFYNQNGYTEFNNYILDYIMPKLSPNAWKVLCFIMRKTKGWQKEQDEISLNQIMDGTGIKNRTTTCIAIKELEKDKYVLVTHSDDRITSNAYALNTDLEIETGSTETVLPTQEGGTEIVPSEAAGSTKTVPVGSTEIVPEVVQKSDSQKKDSKKPINKLSKDNGEKSPLLPDTPQSQLLFEKLKTEFNAKGRHAPQKFPSLACKRKFDARAKYLNSRTALAINRALEKGILSVTGIVDFIAKWEPKNGQVERGSKKTTIDEEPYFDVQTGEYVHSDGKRTTSLQGP